MSNEPLPLHAQHCRPPSAQSKLDPKDVARYLEQVSGWKKADDCEAITKEFRFGDYFHTMAFVNTVASIAHREDHHPDLEVGYNKCVVRYSTHDAKGLTLNDFICAAKVEDMLVRDGGAAT